ncbi:hypothetical protein RHGRI_016955 [Rhododendron griersonianum]|uniref:Thioredoxin domain-containing protein n=1 Tax=Rhododendron griersonianum TaxID=479676 RepID=A0AAV6JW39_9ERIC|nr:hypothetical protein RHGRI_016955 [Rhododendron griersonianum]
MAITIAAAAIRPLNLDHFSCLSPSSSKLSQLSSRQFIQHLGRIQIGNKGLSSRSRRRILPLVDPMKAALNSSPIVVERNRSRKGNGKWKVKHDFRNILGNGNARSKPRSRHFLPLMSCWQIPTNLYWLIFMLLGKFFFGLCGPCQFMAPVLNEVSAAMIDKIQVVKIDTEKYPSIADKYRIEALPTFIIFKDGEPYDRFVSGNL